MLIDAFPFYNEQDLLDLRLNELHDVVDWFVIVEATHTHSGIQKPLYLSDNLNRFKDFWNKMQVCVVDDMPITQTELQDALSSKDREWIESGYQVEDSWIRERYQRNQMMNTLNTFDPNDIVIIEDADEMVKHDILRDIESIIVDGSNAVEQTLNTYYMNWKCTNMPWYGSKILRNKFITTPSEDRFHTVASKYIYNGGYHFGYLGGAEAVANKIKAFAHQEFAVPNVLNNIDNLLKQKKDGIGRQYQYEVVPIDESYPKYLRDNPEKFEHLMYHE